MRMPLRHGYRPRRRRIKSIFLYEAMLCTSTHHFCTQSCSFNGTFNFFVTFLTMDESWPILGSYGFYQSECGSVVTCSIQCKRKCSVHVFTNSLCELSVFKVCVNPYFPGVILQSYSVLNLISSCLGYPNFRKRYL